MRKITFDIETKNTFQDVGSNEAVDLDVSLVCLHDSKTNEYHTFMHDELDKLWPFLEKADVLIGYNSDHFDIPILNKYYHGDLTSIKSVDILKEIKNSLGKRIKLDTVAEATLGTNKSGAGLDAVKWWNSGEVEKIKKYCLDDVRITKEIYEYAVEHKKLKYKDRITHKILEIDLNTDNWEKKEDNGIIQSLF
ncbi:ribonuclease H-like domain-containing protein [Patescibacteria group bacterium]|nr:ribonuclease H-like domain-containing protein [Patescibacteria group bacterium]MCG2695218.1 ribonuclease H-like domain-containing protein [Candidatus Parcubacteria bacterium]